MKKHKLALTGSIVYILFTNLVELFIPWILKLAIDSIGKLPNGQVQLIKYGLMLVAVSAVGGVLRFYMRIISSIFISPFWLIRLSSSFAGAISLP